MPTELVARLERGVLHVLVLGPGFGESILIRSPEGSWIVVDCFRHPKRSGLAYPFQVLGDEVGRIAGVILTHPHEDHAPGLERLLEDAPQAWIGCVPVWVESEAGQNLHRHVKLDASVNALSSVITAWDSPERRWETWAGAERRVDGMRLQILHPTPDFVSTLLAESSGKKLFNRLSSPVLVHWEDVVLLLGADLGTGEWELIDPSLDLSRHHLYKVAHHGSEHAVTSRLTWTEGRHRLWLVTPWHVGSGQLPRFHDGQGVAQLLEQGVSRLHLTATPARLPGPRPQGAEFRRRDLMDRLQSGAVAIIPGGPSLSLAPSGDAPMAGWVHVGLTPDGDIAAFNVGPDAVAVIP